MSKRGQNEGSIYQRNDGRWCATVNLGWVNGKRQRKSYYAETRKDVQEQLTKALSDIQKGLPLVMGKQNVGGYLDWWVDNVAKATVRPSTWISYEELVRLHLRSAFEKISLPKLSPQHVRSLLSEKLASGLSARRVQYLHAVLRAALNTALKDQLIVRNVAAIVKPPRVIGKEVQPLTPDEARRFLASIRGNRLEALFTVAISVGLRQGEALGLRWRDVDFEAGTMRIRYALQRLKARKEAIKGILADDAQPQKPDSSGFHLVEPKTKQSRRIIALPKLTLSALAEHKERLNQERLLAGTAWKSPAIICEGEKIAFDDFVFVTMFGNPFDAPTVTHRFQALLTKAGIGHHRFHDLRHTAATLLAVQGVHRRAIQAALGWENLSMLNRYVHFVEEQRQAVASAMESILTPVAVNASETKPN